MSDIKILFFDADGTLIGPNFPVMSKKTVEALNRAREKGVKLVLTTGRTTQELEILSYFTFDAYCLMNGQVCYAGDAVLRLNPVPREDVRALVEILTEDPFPCAFVELNRCYINHLSEHAQRLYSMVNSPFPPVMNPREALTGDIYQMNFFTTPEREEAALKRMPGTMSRRWSSIHSDIIARSGGKKDGVEAALKHFGLTRDQAASFGDGENDLDMFEATRYSFAMGNASDAVKAGATHVTGRFDEDGVVSAMIELKVIEPF